MQFDWIISWLSNNMKVKINFGRIRYAMAKHCLMFGFQMCIFFTLFFSKYDLKKIYLAKDFSFLKLIDTEFKLM